MVRHIQSHYSANEAKLLCAGNVSGSQKQLRWDWGEWQNPKNAEPHEVTEVGMSGWANSFSILTQLSFPHQDGNQSSTIRWINYQWYNSYTKYKTIQLFNSWTRYEYYACMLPRIIFFLAAQTFFLCSCAVIAKNTMLTWIKDNATITFLTYDTLLWLKLKNHL